MSERAFNHLAVVELFGRNVARRTNQRIAVGQAAFAIAGHNCSWDFRNAKIQDLYMQAIGLVGAQKEVAGLHVAMDDAQRMRFRQRIATL